MHFIKSLFLLSSTVISLTTSLTIKTPKVIYNTTGFLENLAIRPNGNVLVTRIDVPQLWEINPANGSGVLVHDFQSSSINTILGITEYEKDVYAVGGGTINQSTVMGEPGTWAVWKVDMRVKRGALAKVELITTIPEAVFLNGMAVLPPPAMKTDEGSSQGNSILVSDSTAGVIYVVSPSRKTYSVFYSNPDTMLPPPNAAPPLGVNGVRISSGHGNPRHLYYSTTFPTGFYRVRLDGRNVVEGVPELLFSADVPLDDFALAKDGTAYLASNAGNVLMKRGRDGTVTVIGGDGTNGTVFAGPTSVRLGRVRGRDTAYVTTAVGRLVAVAL
jgi:hypothetical protein